MLEQLIAKAIASEMMSVKTSDPVAFQDFQKAFNGVTKVTADLNPDVQAGTVTEAALTQAITDMVELLGQFGLNTVFHL
jgi:hypothetical protein